MAETENKRFVVTLDGPAGAGKTTMAKYLAKAIPGTAYLDTGAIYRTLALAAMRSGAAQKTRLTEALVKKVETLRPRAELVLASDGSYCQNMYLGGDLIPDPDLRLPAVSAMSSVIAVNRGFRRIANDIARSTTGSEILVVDGRDAGTAIFPDADLKFFLWAQVAERAQRRQAQERAAGTARPLPQIESDLRSRDARDSGREEDPLKFPDDAIWIDTGAFLEEGVMHFLRDAVTARLDPKAAKII